MRDLSRLRLLYKDYVKRCFYHVEEFDVFGYLSYKFGSVPKFQRILSSFQELLAKCCLPGTSKRSICSFETGIKLPSIHLLEFLRSCFWIRNVIIPQKKRRHSAALPRESLRVVDAAMTWERGR